MAGSDGLDSPVILALEVSASDVGTSQVKVEVRSAKGLSSADASTAAS